MSGIQGKKTEMISHDEGPTSMPSQFFTSSIARLRCLKQGVLGALFVAANAGNHRPSNSTRADNRIAVIAHFADNVRETAVARLACRQIRPHGVERSITVEFPARTDKAAFGLRGWNLKAQDISIQ